MRRRSAADPRAMPTARLPCARPDVPERRNWQTRGTRSPVGFPPVWVRFPPPAPAFAPLQLAALFGELRLASQPQVRRLSRRSNGRKGSSRTVAKADHRALTFRPATFLGELPVPPKPREAYARPDRGEGGRLGKPAAVRRSVVLPPSGRAIPPRSALESRYHSSDSRRPPCAARPAVRCPADCSFSLSASP